MQNAARKDLQDKLVGLKSNDHNGAQWGVFSGEGGGYKLLPRPGEIKPI